MQIRFQIDPDEPGIPIRPQWTARHRLASDRGCVEFRIGVDFERARCRIGPTTFDFRVVGTNLMRNLYGSVEPGESTRSPFRKSAEGRWTVLEVLVPGDNRASFLLAFDVSRRRGMITSVPGEDPRVLRAFLERLFGTEIPRRLSSRDDERSARRASEGREDPRTSSGSKEDPRSDRRVWLGTNTAPPGEWLPDLDGKFDLLG